MPQRIFFSIVVLVFLFNGEILGQEKNVEKIPLINAKLLDYRQSTHYINPTRNVETPGLNFKSPTGYPLKNILSPSTVFTINNPLSKDYYSNNLSFFCRKELQIEKATSVPLRFRLGSLEYTDYLERKPNARLNR